MLYPQTLSTIRPSTGQNKRCGNILLCETSVISIMIGHFHYKHRCLVEKNVPIAVILPSRWWDGAESLGIEYTNCLWQQQPHRHNHHKLHINDFYFEILKMPFESFHRFTRLEIVSTTVAATTSTAPLGMGHQVTPQRLHYL